MNLFSRRPLATGGLLFMITIFLLMRVTESIQLPLFLLLASLFLLCFCFLFFLGYGKRRVFLFVCSLFLLLSLLSVFLFRQAERPLINAVGDNVTATVTVEEVLGTNAGGATLLVRVERLDGEKVCTKAILLTAYPSPFLEGDTLEGEFEVSSLEVLGFGGDNTYYYRGLGAAAVLESNAQESVSITKSVGGTRLLAERLRHTLAGRIEMHLTCEAGALLRAMLFGERDALSSMTVQSFRASGVSHLLALSGLHLGILVLAVEGILQLFRVRRSIRKVLVLAFLLFFLFLTGFSFSLLRAALMLLSLYIGHSFYRNGDSITALSFAGTLILCFSPFAVFSTSFQMTVLATFGLLAFGRANAALLYRLTGRREEAGIFRRCLSFILSSLLVSFSASFAVFAVQWLTFGEFSLATPLANLLLVPLATLLLPLGILLVVFPLPLLAFPVRLVANAMLWIATLFSGWDTVISLRFAFVPYLLIPTIAATLLLLAVKLKRKNRPLVLLPMLVFTLSFAMLFGVTRTLADDSVAVTYAREGNNESISLLRGDESMLIDLSSGGTGQLYEGWTALKTGGATSLDVLLLTHYHSYHATSVPRFCLSVAVGEIWVPTPKTEAEAEILSYIYAAAAAQGTAVALIEENKPLSVFGSGTLTLATYAPANAKGESAYLLTLTLKEKTLVYQSAALFELLDDTGDILPKTNADMLILGIHGRAVKQDIRFSALEGGTVILGDEALLPLLEIQEKRQYLLPEEGTVRFGLQ